MFSLGPGDLTLVLVAVLLVFSSGRLGSLGDALGRLVTGKRGGEKGAPGKPDAPAPPSAGGTS